MPASWRRASLAGRAVRGRWLGYLAAGIVFAATVGSWLVFVLIACGAIEVVLRTQIRTHRSLAVDPIPLLLAGVATTGVLASVVWVALKVGALSHMVVGS